MQSRNSHAKCLILVVFSGDVETGKKVKVVHGGRKGTEKKHIGHTSQILCIAISTDGQFLVCWADDSLTAIL